MLGNPYISAVDNPVADSSYGEVSEWLKEHAWKVCIRQRIEGSNPSLTAIFKEELACQCGLFLLPVAPLTVWPVPRNTHYGAMHHNGYSDAHIWCVSFFISVMPLFSGCISSASTPPNTERVQFIGISS